MREVDETAITRLRSHGRCWDLAKRRVETYIEFVRLQEDVLDRINQSNTPKLVKLVAKMIEITDKDIWSIAPDPDDVIWISEALAWYAISIMDSRNPLPPMSEPQ